MRYAVKPPINRHEQAKRQVLLGDHFVIDGENVAPQEPQFVMRLDLRSGNALSVNLLCHRQFALRARLVSALAVD